MLSSRDWSSLPPIHQQVCFLFLLFYFLTLCETWEATSTNSVIQLGVKFLLKNFKFVYILQQRIKSRQIKDTYTHIYTHTKFLCKKNLVCWHRQPFLSLVITMVMSCHYRGGWIKGASAVDRINNSYPPPFYTVESLKIKQLIHKCKFSFFSSFQTDTHTASLDESFYYLESSKSSFPSSHALLTQIGVNPPNHHQPFI